jgi:hypothetical protein
MWANVEEFLRSTVPKRDTSVLTDAKEAEVKAENTALAAATPEPVIVRRYGTIVIDPPWEMEKIKRDVRRPVLGHIECIATNGTFWNPRPVGALDGLPGVWAVLPETQPVGLLGAPRPHR